MFNTVEVDVCDGPALSVDESEEYLVCAVEIYPLFGRSIVRNHQGSVLLVHDFHLLNHQIYNKIRVSESQMHICTEVLKA